MLIFTKKQMKVSHPNKIGKVGPKKKDQSQLKKVITIYLKGCEIEQLGGKEQVKCLLHNYLKSKL